MDDEVAVGIVVAVVYAVFWIVLIVLIVKGDKKFKATQVFEWIYKKRIISFDEMRNVSKETIKDL